MVHDDVAATEQRFIKLHRSHVDRWVGCGRVESHQPVELITGPAVAVRPRQDVVDDAVVGICQVNVGIHEAQRFRRGLGLVGKLPGTQWVGAGIHQPDTAALEVEQVPRLQVGHFVGDEINVPGHDKVVLEIPAVFVVKNSDPGFINGWHRRTDRRIHKPQRPAGSLGIG